MTPTDPIPAQSTGFRAGAFPIHETSSHLHPAVELVVDTTDVVELVQATFTTSSQSCPIQGSSKCRVNREVRRSTTGTCTGVQGKEAS